MQMSVTAFFVCSITTALLPAEYSQQQGPWIYPRHPSVQDPPSPPGDGTIAFAGSITDYAVLQKGMGTAAALYGTLPNDAAVQGAHVSVLYSNADDHSDANYTVAAEVISGTNVSYWKALLKPRAVQGGDITLTASCDGCGGRNGGGTSSVTVHHLVYGDVWFCAGQSNMELPMQHALTRNRTYELLDRAANPRYRNIRTFKHAEHTALPDGAEQWSLPPPPAPACQATPGGEPRCYFGWQVPNSSVVDEFSAACWFAAQELTDLSAELDGPAVPPPVLGLIQSAWGGTEIELWLKNDTVADCKNASGGDVGTNGGTRLNGALWNGMVAPFINYTIFGALWYQGENNVHECVGAGDRGGHPGQGEPSACGNALKGTGYACQTKSLVGGWRKQWSAVPGTTAADFPFGIVSLAAGTSEGHSNSMAAFRHAQTASLGTLPGPKGSGMERTFLAQAYDAADPGDRARAYSGADGTRTGPPSQADAPFQSQYDAPFPGRAGYTAGGMQRYTQQYMGGLHPRSKQIIGRRLALGAAAVAYGRAVAHTGPVLRNCSVLPAGRRCLPGSADYAACAANPDYRYMGIAQRQITLNFDEQLLGTDAVQVWPTTPDTEGLAMVTMFNCLNGTCFEACGTNATCVSACATLRSPQCTGLAVTPLGPNGNGGNPTQYDAGHMHFRTGRVVSPLEVQLNGTVWMPASISFNAGDGGDPLHRGDCQATDPDPRKHCTNWTRRDGWSSVVAQVPIAIPIGCGRGFDRDGRPQLCPPAEELRADDWCENCTAHFLPTGVRYAWAENPCCGGQPPSSNILPCPVNSCPISTYNSTLPAVPFSASLLWNNETANGVGTCKCEAPAKCS